MSTYNLEPEHSTDDPTMDLDHRIVLATQAGLPIHELPYAIIAEQVGSSNDQVKARIKAMLLDGRIRRIGVVPNHYRLGYTANGMSVWDVDDSDANAAGHLVGELEMVSHCYLRPRSLPDWPYNLFAMVHGHNRDEVMEKVSNIHALLADKVRTHDVLFSKRILKKTGMRLS